MSAPFRGGMAGRFKLRRCPRAAKTTALLMSVHAKTSDVKGKEMYFHTIPQSFPKGQSARQEQSRRINRRAEREDQRKSIFNIESKDNQIDGIFDTEGGKEERSGGESLTYSYRLGCLRNWKVRLSHPQST